MPVTTMVVVGGGGGGGNGVDCGDGCGGWVVAAVAVAIVVRW